MAGSASGGRTGGSVRSVRTGSGTVLSGTVLSGTAGSGTGAGALR